MNTVCILVCVVTGLNIILSFQKPGFTFGLTSCCSRYTASNEYKPWNLCVMNNGLIYFSLPPKGCKCSPLFLSGNHSNKLLIVTLKLHRAVAWPKYTGGSDPEKVPVPDVNSGVNVGDPGPNVCPYPIEMYMLGFPIH